MVLPVVVKKQKRRLGCARFMFGILIGFVITIWTIIKSRLEEWDDVTSAPVISQLRTFSTKAVTPTFSLLESKIDPKEPGILVIYSGPLYVDDETDVDMNELFRANFEWFLKNGVDCDIQDTVIVVGKPVFDKYKNQIEDMDRKCMETNHRIKIVHRHPECFHMGSMSLILHGGFIPFDHYKFFIQITNDLSGPFEKTVDEQPWTLKFTSRMNDNVRLVGLSHVCDGHHSHVQEHAYCLDNTGLELLRQSDVILNCETFISENSRKADNIERDSIENWHKQLEMNAASYPIAMSQLILNQANYTFTSILQEPLRPINKENRLTCVADDMWTVSHLKSAYNGNLPSWPDLIFFKTTRYLSDDIAKTIGFKGNATWIWE